MRIIPIIYKTILAAFICFAFAVSIANSASIVGSKHDLTSNGNSTTDQPCVFCHTPHMANTDLNVPLWNRNTIITSFTMYQSSTMDSSHPGQPNGVSLACLSCHDGVLNDIGDVINAPGSGLGDGVGCKECHYPPPPLIDYGEAFPSYLGTGLTNDHPISIGYPTLAQDSQFTQPTLIDGIYYVVSGAVNLPLWDGANKYLECATCHDVHDPAIEPFLRATNDDSALCTVCHNK